MGDDFAPILAFTLGAFAGAVLIAFAASRLGLYFRRSTRYEPATLVGVHIICFFLLGMVACSAKASSPGSSGLTVFVAQLVVFLWDLLRLPNPEDYRDDVPQTTRPLAGARLAAFAAAALLGFGLVYAAARPASDLDLVAEIEASVRQVPGGAIYFEALKRDFPQEYHALAIETAQRLRASRQRLEGPAAQEQIGRSMGLQILALARAKAPDMAKAPTPALNAYSRSMKDYALALQRISPLTCAALVVGLHGTEAEVKTPDAAHEISARILAARLDLARAGLDRPTRRQVTPPPETALRKLEDEIRRRDPVSTRYLGDPRMTSYLPVRERCALAVHYHSAIADMPSETSAILAAYDLVAASPDSASASAPPP
jgi:hypothetical protein